MFHYRRMPNLLQPYKPRDQRRRTYDTSARDTSAGPSMLTAALRLPGMFVRIGVHAMEVLKVSRHYANRLWNAMRTPSELLAPILEDAIAGFSASRVAIISST